MVLIEMIKDGKCNGVWIMLLFVVYCDDGEYGEEVYMLFYGKYK